MVDWSVSEVNELQNAHRRVEKAGLLRHAKSSSAVLKTWQMIARSLA